MVETYQRALFRVASMMYGAFRINLPLFFLNQVIFLLFSYNQILIPVSNQTAQTTPYCRRKRLKCFWWYYYLHWAIPHLPPILRDFEFYILRKNEIFAPQRRNIKVPIHLPLQNVFKEDHWCRPWCWHRGWQGCRLNLLSVLLISTAWPVIKYLFYNLVFYVFFSD